MVLPAGSACEVDGMLDSVLKATGALLFLGVVSAILLAVAARRFHVVVDARVEAVEAALPGSNCGACGNPSCFAVAEGIVAGDLATNTCVAGGQAVADAVAHVMEAEACVVEHVISARHCGGGTNAVRSYDYSGVPSCASANRLAGGPLTCRAGCLGFGDCVRACPFDAMALDARGLPVIDPVKCTGCGICVKECPRGQIRLLELVPESAPIVVRCNAHDKPKERKANCSMCCIACKKCERECPSDAIHVIDLLAVVDYEKCTGCGTCLEVCPQRCIDVYGCGSGVDSVARDGVGPGIAEEQPAKVSAGASTGAEAEVS